MSPSGDAVYVSETGPNKLWKFAVAEDRFLGKIASCVNAVNCFSIISHTIGSTDIFGPHRTHVWQPLLDISALLKLLHSGRQTCHIQVKMTQLSLA